MSGDVDLVFEEVEAARAELGTAQDGDQRAA